MLFTCVLNAWTSELVVFVLYGKTICEYKGDTAWESLKDVKMALYVLRVIEHGNERFSTTCRNYALIVQCHVLLSESTRALINTCLLLLDFPFLRFPSRLWSNIPKCLDTSSNLYSTIQPGDGTITINHPCLDDSPAFCHSFPRLRHPGPLRNRRSEAAATAATDAFALLPSRLLAAARGHAVRHQSLGQVLGLDGHRFEYVWIYTDR